MSVVSTKQTSASTSKFDSTIAHLLFDYHTLESVKTNGSEIPLVDFQHQLHDAAKTYVKVFASGRSSPIKIDSVDRQISLYEYSTAMLLSTSIRSTDFVYSLLLSPSASQEQIKCEFEKLHQDWREDTKFESSATKIVEHPAYQKIISWGAPMIPFILEEIHEGSNHWFYALQEITGFTPPHAEKLSFEALRDAWLDWSEQQEKTVKIV